MKFENFQKNILINSWARCDIGEEEKKSKEASPTFFPLVHQFIPICQFSFGRKRVLSVCSRTQQKKFILFHHLHGACQFLPTSILV